MDLLKFDCTQNNWYNNNFSVKLAVLPDLTYYEAVKRIAKTQKTVVLSQEFNALGHFKAVATIKYQQS